MVQQVSEETLLMPLKKDQLHYTVGPKDNNFYCFFLKTKKKIFDYLYLIPIHFLSAKKSTFLKTAAIYIEYPSEISNSYSYLMKWPTKNTATFAIFLE